MNIPLKKFKVSHNSPEVIDIIQKIVNETRVKPFGYQTVDDIKQEIWVICIKALDEWEPEKITEDTKSLSQAIEKFLRVTVRNRLINKFKEITRPVESPCPRCQYYSPDKGIPGDCKKYGEDKDLCAKYKKYTFFVNGRNDLLNVITEQEETNFSDEWSYELSADDIKRNIEERLDENTRRDFRNMLASKNVSKKSISKIKEVTRALLEEERKNDVE